MQKTSKLKRFTAMLLAVLMISNGTLQTVTALEGEITSRERFTFTEAGYKSETWDFELKDSEGNMYEGTCMEPDNQTIPEVNSEVTMNFCKRDGKWAKIVYKGLQLTGVTNQERNYIISRAVAKANGYTGSYSKQTQVNALYNAGVSMSGSIPKTLVVYATDNGDPGQKIIAWRWQEEEKEPPYIILTKTANKDVGVSVKGAKYGVYTTKNAAESHDIAKMVGSLTVKADGTSNKLEVEPGRYFVKEYYAPPGLELDTKIRGPKTLYEGGKWEISALEEVTEAKVSVQKTTTIMNVPPGLSLAGAQYGVYTSYEAAEKNWTGENYRVGVLTTKEDGSTNKLPLYFDDEATYYIKEFDCPSWLEKDPEVHSETFHHGDDKVITSTDPPASGFIKLKKAVSGVKEFSIIGAKYGVYTSEAAAYAHDTSAMVGTLTVENNETGESNLLPVEAGKTYYVKEYEQPDHYQKDETVHPIIVDYGETSSVNPKFVYSTEIPTPGTIKVQKTTPYSAPTSTQYSKAKARYGLYLSENLAKSRDEAKAFAMMETDEHGNSNVLTLLPGTYWIAETSCPSYMEMDLRIPKVDLSSDEEYVFHSEDSIKTGWAKVKKTVTSESFVLSECPQNYSLAGAEYRIYTDESAAKNQTAGKCVGTLVTDANGNTGELKLSIGDYWIIETKASPGFKKDGKPPAKITIEAGKVTHHRSEEPPMFDPVSIVLDKEPGNNKENRPSLSGAIFKVEYYAKVAKNLSELSGESVKRTWYFTTKEETYNGKTVGIVRLHSDYFAPQNTTPLYKNDQGRFVGMIGSYVITEECAPKGYMKDSTPILTTVDNTGTASSPAVSYTNKTNINHPKEFHVILEKQDTETGKRAQGDATLEGAVFGLYRDGKEIGRYTTGKNNSFTTESYNIGEGSQVYTLKEIKPPLGYLPHDKAYRLNELEGDTLKLQYNPIDRLVKNTVIKGKIAITKILNAQADTGALDPEPGIQFQIYLTSAGCYEKALDSEKQLITTDKSGYAETKMLPYGTYTVHQVNTTTGHDKVSDFTVTIDENNETERHTINNDEIDRPVKVFKKDSETGKIIPVAGAKFKVRRAGTTDGWISFHMMYPQDHVMDVFETDNSGTFKLPGNLSFGSYELVEIVPPEGYIFSDTPVPFKVDGSVSLVEVEKKNDPQKGIIKVIKTGEILKRVTENADGSYTPVFGEGRIAGAVFEIFAKTDIVTPEGTTRYTAGEKVDTVKTNGNGVAESKPLYLGQYEVKEITAGENHILNTEVFDAELTYDAQKVQVSYEVGITNERQKAAVSLVKGLETDELYGYGTENHKNITFGIYAESEIAAEDGTAIPKDGLIEVIGITEDGAAYSGSFTCDLPHGSFYVKEADTTEGYILDGTKYPVNFDYTNQTTATVAIAANDGNEIENIIIRGDIAGHKVSETDADLSDAVMGLFKEGETEFTESTALLTDTSDINGAFDFTDVAYGRYIVREIKAPMGYALNTTEYPVEVTTDGQVIEMDLVNEVTKFDIAKTDIATGDYVIGAQLAIIPLDKEGNPDVGATFETWITEDKEHRVKGLEVGKTYILRETLSGEAWDKGYVTAEDIEFTVSDTGEVQKVEMKDDFTKVDIAKTDIATGDYVIGAQLAIIPLDEKGNPNVSATFETWITGKKEHRVERLPVGDYILRETKAPVGYVKAKDMKLTVEDTDEVQMFELKNDYTKVFILKRDAENNKALTGAKLQLLDQSGDIVADWISEEKGKLFYRLGAGTYTLKELEAPAGYDLAAPMQFVVEETADVQLFDILNHKFVEPEVIPESEPVPEPEYAPEPEPAPEAEPTPMIDSEPDSETTPLPESNDTPQTGDGNHLIGWMSLAFLGISGAVAGRKRRN